MIVAVAIGHLKQNKEDVRIKGERKCGLTFSKPSKTQLGPKEKQWICWGVSFLTSSVKILRKSRDSGVTKSVENCW